MSNDYNGWSNRATWNVNLWLSNDESLYRDINRLQNRHVDAHPVAEGLESVTDAVKDLLDEVGSDDDVTRRDANTALLVSIQATLKGIESPKPDLDDFAEALEKFCGEMWPNGKTPDGDKLAEADFAEIAASWVEE